MRPIMAEYYRRRRLDATMTERKSAPMQSFHRLFSTLSRWERQTERSWFQFRRRRGWLGPATIQHFRDFGTPERLRVSGRVLAWTSSRKPRLEDRWYRNAASLLRAYLSDEIPNVRVRAQLGDLVAEGVTDQDGYFRIDLKPPEPRVGDHLWRAVDLELLEDIAAGDRPWDTARVLVPPPSARFGVISDLDDTVLHTHTTELWRMLRISLFRNALTRTPLAGVAAFYRALHSGTSGRDRNPIFYVSSSAWNLYDLMRDFLDHNHIPRGPILLREVGLRQPRFGYNNEHKRDKISRILETYPRLPFVLIGDSTEDDPRLYAEAMERYPGRVKAIYIRDVAERNRDMVQRLSRDVAQQDCDMLLVKKTVEAAEHAAATGLIDSGALEEIERESHAHGLFSAGD